MLFYKIEGSIRDIENLTLTPIEIMLRDIGDHSTTGFTYDRECVDFIMKNPHLDEDGIIHGMIHSHHTMSVFFSPTDVAELQDNVENHNIYLSLVINNFMDMAAKVTFVAKPVSYVCPDENGEEYDLELTGMEKVMFVYDCKIEQPKEEIVVDNQFMSTLQDVRMKVNKRNEEAAKKKQAEAKAKWEAEQAKKAANPQMGVVKSPGYGGGGYGQHGATQNYGGTQQGFHEGNKQEEEDAEVQTYYEDFFAYCLNGGSHTNLTEDSIVLQIEREKAGELTCNMVMNNYATYYQSYFEVDTYGMDSREFIDCIEEFIEFCETAAAQDITWMGTLGEGLEKIKNKFLELNLNQKVNGTHAEV